MKPSTGFVVNVLNYESGYHGTFHCVGGERGT